VTEDVACARCSKVVCNTRYSDRGAENCPTLTKKELIERVSREYEKSEIREFAYQACKQHNEGMMTLPDGGRVPSNPRVEETVQFARKMGYRKLGLAFCGALRKEAGILTQILENRGFQTVSACCMIGGVSVTSVGIKDEDKLGGPEAWQTMCNPLVQAEVLNGAGTDFNIMLGLCVGHDSLFLKHSQALVTVMVVKDRVFGHNPVAALYQADVFYRWLARKDAGE